MKDWFKTKCTERQEFVIAGYVPSTTSGKMVGSLVMAVYDKGRLVHVGRVGTGFKDAVARSLRDQLERLKRPTSPFPNKLPADAVRGVRWIEPKLVAEVELRGWTTTACVGAPPSRAFAGTRTRAGSSRDPPRGGEHQGRRHALAYASRPAALARRRPHGTGFGGVLRGRCRFGAAALIGRPFSLVWCPSGTASKCFFQKPAWKGMAGSVKRRDISDDDVLYIGDLDGLIALVQASILEIHPWGSTLAKVEAPDRITFNLIRERMSLDRVDRRRDRGARAAAGDPLENSSNDGGRGLRVVVPLTPKAD